MLTLSILLPHPFPLFICIQPPRFGLPRLLFTYSLSSIHPIPLSPISCTFLNIFPPVLYTLPSSLFFGHTEPPIPSSSVSILILFDVSSPHQRLHSLPKFPSKFQYTLNLSYTIMSSAPCLPSPFVLTLSITYMLYCNDMSSSSLRSSMITCPRYLRGLYCVYNLDKTCNGQTSKAYDMEINAEKSKLMTNNINGIHKEIKASGQKLQTVTNFK